MSNKFQPWWLRFCIASFLLTIPVKPHPTRVCEKNNVNQNVIIRCRSNIAEDDQISIKISPDEEIEITCTTYNNLDYLESIDKISTTSTFKRLVISKCPVPNISFFDIFSTLKISQVKSIRFQSSNSFSVSFKMNTFEKLEAVEILHLESNNIDTLPDQIFNGMVALEELNLSDNRLKSIPEKLFGSLKKLRKLDLQRNNFTNLDGNVFQFVPILTYLNLCDNRLNDMSTSVLSSLTNLTILEICNNNITYLEDGLFNNLKNLEEINLSNNRLTTLPRSLFDRCTKLKILRLNGNFLNVLPESIFKYTKSLKILDLSNNQLESLGERIFDRLTNLSTLRLNENNISVINWDIFHKLTSLIELNLSRNKLKVLDKKTFLDLILVETIDLSYNQLTLEEANLGVFSPFVACINLKYLRLHHNSVTREFADWCMLSKTLKEFSLTDNQIKNPHSQIRCSYVNHSVAHEWEEETCPTTFILILKCLAISGYLLITAITLYYKYRENIKLWMFSHNICLWLVTEKEIDQKKIYDAFISFSYKDQHFVDQQLIPELEENGDPTFKLCIHYRDFVVGEYIPSQIIFSVENSRRTIIILSPNFLQSTWTRMEFKVAHLQAIKERCDRIIVILLEEVDDEQLDLELKTYIEMNTCVKWGDPLFWEKLRFALRHPQ